MWSVGVLLMNMYCMMLTSNNTSIHSTTSSPTNTMSMSIQTNNVVGIGSSRMSSVFPASTKHELLLQYANILDTMIPTEEEYIPSYPQMGGNIQPQVGSNIATDYTLLPKWMIDQCPTQVQMQLFIPKQIQDIPDSRLEGIRKQWDRSEASATLRLSHPRSIGQLLQDKKIESLYRLYASSSYVNEDTNVTQTNTPSLVNKTTLMKGYSRNRNSIELSAFISLLSTILVWDPKQRITPVLGLKHPWISK